MENMLVSKGSRRVGWLVRVTSAVCGCAVAFGQGGTLSIHGGVLQAPPAVTDAIAVDLTNDSGVAVRANGTLVQWGNFLDAPPSTSDAVKVIMDRSNAMVLNGDGTVETWGTFEAPIPEGLDDVVDAEIGFNSYAALRSDGSIVMWGELDSNFRHPSLQSSNLAPVVDFATSQDAGLALHADGSMSQWGADGIPWLAFSAGSIFKVSASPRNSGAIGADGEFQSLTSFTPSVLPTVSPLSLSELDFYGVQIAAALVSDGTVRAFPANPASLVTDVIATAGGGGNSAAAVSIATITAPAAAPFANVLPRDLDKAVGSTTLFKAHVTGVVSSYQWRRDGADLPGETNPWLLMENVVEADSGAYTVLLANQHGSYETTPSTLTVSAFSGGTLTQYGNGFSQPPSVDDAIKVELADQRGYALRHDGSIVEWGDRSGLDPAPVIDDGVTIFSYWRDAMVIRADGSVATWGLPGIAPVPAGLDDVVDAAMSDGGFIALKSDGTLVAWGPGLDDGFGLFVSPPAGLNQVVDVEMGWEGSFALKADGTVIRWPDVFNGGVTGLTDAVKISADFYHVAALKEDGTIDGLFGAAGLAPPDISPLKYVDVEYAHEVFGTALVEDGTFRAMPDSADVAVDHVIDEAIGGLGDVEGHVVATITSPNALPYARVLPVYVQRNSGAVVFKAHTTGVVTSYQWKLDGVDLPGETKPWLYIDAVAASDYGNYTVALSNQYGSFETIPSLLAPDLTDQTISFDPPADRTFGDPAFDLTATASSGLPVEFSIVSGPAEVSGSTLTLTGAGTVVVRASQPGDDSFDPAPAVDQAFEVAPLAISVSLGSLATVYDGDPNPASATTNPPGVSVAFAYDGGPVAPINAGTYAVVATVSDPSYMGSAAGTLVISRADQTITFDLPSEFGFDASPIALGASASSGLPIVYVVVSGDATASGSSLTLSGIGEVTVRAEQPGDSNHNSALGVERTFTALPGSQAIDFPPIPGPFDYIDTLFADPVDLDATASSGLPVSYELVSGPGMIGDGYVTLLGAGTIVIRATQAGDGVWMPADPVEQTIVVERASQGVEIQPIGNRAFTPLPFTPTVLSDTGLPPVFEIESGPAVIENNEIVFTGIGNVIMVANVPGDENWLPGTDVTGFVISPAPQTIAFDPIDDQPFDAQPFDLVVSINTDQPVTLEILSGAATLDGQTLSLGGTGIVTVRATQEGDENYLPAAPVLRSFLSGYVLTSSSSAGGVIGATPGLEIYGEGTPVLLEAIESPIHRFVGWGGDLSGTTTPQTLFMDSHRSVSAEFKRIWQLNVTSSAGGSVEVSPVQAEYLDGDQVTLTPVPGAGYELGSWSGDAGGVEAPLEITLTDNTSIHANFVDVELPVVQIFSPAGGTTNNQFGALFGTVSDNNAIASLRWERDGDPAGALGSAGGTFNVTSLVLHPGENVVTVIARDPGGNEGSDEVSITWDPDRTLTLGAPAETREGKRMTLPMSLESSGMVSGMTFVVNYDPQYLTTPEVVLTGPVASGVSQINTDVPGEIRITFSLPATALPAGVVQLGTATFRARSVPFDLTTFFDVEVLDVSNSDGEQIDFGTHTEGSEARVVQRLYTGDINTNDRLDTGDAYLMQRMLTGLDPIRFWDHPLNDLNASGLIDSGDVTRVLRTIVGIDPQPGAAGRAARGRRPRGGEDAGGPEARMELDQNYGAADDEITLLVSIEDLDYSPAGAAFTLDYPADALRLTDFTSHQAGDLVGAGSAVLWNVAPDFNNYATQSGSISFVASSSLPWPGAEPGGVLAELTFRVQLGATAQPTWPITLRDIELPTSDGFDVLTPDGSSATFIGQPQTFASWLQEHLTPEQLANPEFSDPGADPEHDGLINLIEYATAGDPLAADTNGVRARTMLYEGERFLAIDYRISALATDLSHRVQISHDLESWADADDSNTDLVSERTSDDGALKIISVRDLDPLGSSPATELRVEFDLNAE